MMSNIAINVEAVDAFCGNNVILEAMLRPNNNSIL
jgi:hypothetical protein